MPKIDHSFKVIIFDLDDTLYDTSSRLDAVTPNYAEMKLFEGGRDILEKIKSKKILLTHGDEAIQNRKIDILGVRALFDEIIIVSSLGDKLTFFEKMKSEFSDPKEVAVVGDRRDSEIRFGNMMGFVTILLKQGKYKDNASKDDLEIPTYEIMEFREIVQHI